MGGCCCAPPRPSRHPETPNQPHRAAVAFHAAPPRIPAQRPDLGARPQRLKMAQQFVQTKITGGKVVVFVKPTCPYCVMAQRVFSEYKFKPGHLECVDISGHRDMDKIQDYFMELTGARTVKAASLGLDAQRADAFASHGGLVCCDNQEVVGSPPSRGEITWRRPPGFHRPHFSVLRASSGFHRALETKYSHENGPETTGNGDPSCM